MTWASRPNAGRTRWEVQPLFPASILLLCVWYTSASAQDPPPTSSPPAVALTASDETPHLPDTKTIQRRRAEIEANTELDEEARTELLAKIDDTLRKITEAEAAATRLQSLKQAASNAPEAILAAERALQEAEKGGEPDPEFFGSPDELQAAKLAADQAAADARQKREELEAARTTRAERLAAVPKLLSDMRDQLNSRLQAPTAAADADALPFATQAQQWSQMATTALLQQQIAVLQQEKTTFEMERPLIEARIQLAKLEEERMQARATVIAKRFAEDRVLKVRRRIVEFEAEIAKTPLDDNELTVETRDIASQWQPLVQGQADVEAEITELSLEASKLKQDYESINSQVQKELEHDTGLSSAMGLMLQQKRASLPNETSLRRRLAQTNDELDEVRALLSEIGLVRESISRQTSSHLPSDEKYSSDYKILERFLEPIERDANNYRNLLLSKSIEQQDYLQSIRRFATMIDGHVLWFRSAERFSWEDFPLAWRAFQGLVYPANLRGVANALWEEANENLLLTVAWGICLILLLFAMPRLRRRLQTLGSEASRGTSVDMKPTWSAVLTTLILSLLMPMALAVPGWRLAYADKYSPYIEATGYGLLFAAMFVFPLELIRQVVRPGGLALAHFGWSERSAASSRRHLRWFLDLALPFVFVWSLLLHCGNVRWETSLGRLVFVILMLQTAWFVRGVMNPQSGAPSLWLLQHRDGWIDRLRVVWHNALFGTPLLLGLLSLAGYSYSAHQLADQLYKTLMLAVALILVGGLMRRWAMLNRRAMAIQQVRDRSAASESADRSPIEVTEHPEVNIREANAQTMRLISTSLTVAGLFGFAWIWTSVLPAVDYLDRFTIIPSSGESGDPFTLGDIVIVAPLIALTFIAVRNLPGLLETTLLQRLPLDNAARYAIKTLSSYVMLIAGIMLAARSVGIRWESIQWLVAALGVGLGFGLQEIFANFISGIILLFEQPLRVGDVVTIDGTTGAVSKIRMRATTVINWDRQELIIPNKDLITGRLVNWTLSDTTNRLVVNVGVAYGTNTEHACEVLRRICDDHRNISKDPCPVITFEGFGDSTLDLVIRCYLSSLDNRLSTIHELHTNIHNEFNAAGIEISFPQRDLHLRTFPKELLSGIRSGSSDNGVPIREHAK
ncbi:Miniconductance mechanosensitive channel MscM precursor [Rosistilla carotiformis]|uniref:Miniconductance mechanosensitive channel MscM n=1 Tax=Rosistilla carotiformis TaxID=2528017 RepID=A0A518JT90_9BACT|nr:mechanosensitive ion channel domain-containing protein [Rosistilla carotiformis]QDV68756.1 Miniconductance mechanosensitive channel MscM precursor [Rosistilla carotiformis]